MIENKSGLDPSQENTEEEALVEEKPKPFSMQSIQKSKNPASFGNPNTFSKGFKGTTFDSKHRAGRWASRGR